MSTPILCTVVLEPDAAVALHLSRPKHALPKEGGTLELIEALLKGVDTP